MKTVTLLGFIDRLFCLPNFQNSQIDIIAVDALIYIGQGFDNKKKKNLEKALVLHCSTDAKHSTSALGLCDRDNYDEY